MKSHRTIIAIGGLLVALAAALPAPALASSLLSGYGGPGEGNQAILGAALVNGGRGGGSGGSGGAGGAGGGSSSVSAGSSGSPSPAAGAGTGQSAGGSGASGPGAARSLGGASGARREGAARNGARQGTRSAASGEASFYPASERVPAGEGSDALGLSGADLLYMILAVGVLVFMGAITARLSRSTRRAGIGG